jgi:hypothetical protein
MKSKCLRVGAFHGQTQKSWMQEFLRFAGPERILTFDAALTSACSNQLSYRPVAGADEFHQSFVVSRTAAYGGVLIGGILRGGALRKCKA